MNTSQNNLNQPVVSVIIPAYNAENFIAKTLESVLSQTYQKIEVLVVDDGSTDTTAEIVKSFVQKDSRVSLLQQSNAGVAIAVVNERQEVVQVLNVPAQPRDYRVLPPGMENTAYTRPFAADIVLTDLAGPTPFCVWVYLTADESGPKSVVQVPVFVAP